MDPKKVVFASGNVGKVREVCQILSEFTVFTQSQLNVPEIEETGHTFLENALLKARNASLHTGLPALSDDSGLVVDALGGAPGVWSARYAGPSANDRENLEKVLLGLGDVPFEKRTARFVCVLVYLTSPRDPIPVVCQGIWEGRITLSPSGENGFGYDPIFFVPTHGCTSAQLAPEVKNAISHRGQALQLLTQHFQKTLRPQD